LNIKSDSIKNRISKLHFFPKRGFSKLVNLLQNYTFYVAVWNKFLRVFPNTGQKNNFF